MTQGTIQTPLREDEHGAIRVADTRVTLDTIIGAFHQGATPEEVVQQYPSVPLAATYAAIAFYLQNRAEVDAYLNRRREEGDRARRQWEARPDQMALRERLLARRRDDPASGSP